MKKKSTKTKKSAEKTKKVAENTQTPADYQQDLYGSFKIPKKVRAWIKESQFLATTLSIILTFGTTGLLEHCQRIKDRKLSAMMVMGNIETFARQVDEMAEGMSRRDSIATWMLSLPQDSLDLIPSIEMVNVINDLIAGIEFLTHDKTAESIFSNNIETWKNMEKFEFIDNVGTCFSEMNADENYWKEWVEDFEESVNNVLEDLRPGEHTCTKLLQDNVFRQKIESFHVRKAWLEFKAARYRYLNQRSMKMMDIDWEEVEAFANQREKSIDPNEPEPLQSQFRTKPLKADSMTTLLPIRQRIDSIIHGKIKPEP